MLLPGLENVKVRLTEGTVRKEHGEKRRHDLGTQKEDEGSEKENQCVPLYHGGLSSAHPSENP